MAEATQRLVELDDGVSLNIAEVGSGHPLILLHGGPGLDHHELHPWLDPLAGAGFRMIYVDMRGQGESDIASRRHEAIRAIELPGQAPGLHDDARRGFYRTHRLRPQAAEDALGPLRRCVGIDLEVRHLVALPGEFDRQRAAAGNDAKGFVHRMPIKCEGKGREKA